MNKIKILTIITAFILLMLTLGAVSIGAETTPVEVQPTDPVVTQPVTVPAETDPVASETMATATDATDATDYTDPTGTTAVVTEPENEYTRPTEYDENNQPATYSDYVSPAPIYTPAEQDFEENDWEEIELNLSGGGAGVGDFSDIKNNTEKGDKNSPLLLILCIVFWCLALSALTFMILYKPGKKALAAVKAEAKPQKPTRRSSEHTHLDDYNDGF